MKYVVKVLRSNRGDPKTFEEYLVALRSDQYQTGTTDTHETSPVKEEAFVFETLAAAEMAAVFVGGKVEVISG